MSLPPRDLGSAAADTTARGPSALDPQRAYTAAPPAQSAGYVAAWEDPAQAAYDQAASFEPADYSFHWQVPVQPTWTPYTQAPIFPTSSISYQTSPHLGSDSKVHTTPPFSSAQQEQWPASTPSPALPTSNRLDLVSKASANPDRWPCLQCPSQFTRCADLSRHYSTMHGPRAQNMDCPERGCGRVGKNGFSRKDHLSEHLRQYHKRVSVPKRKG